MKELINMLGFFVGRGIRSDSLVVFYLERGIDYLVLMLSVWKAGGAFVPLDPQHPNEKNKCILNNLDFTMLLLHSSNQSKLKSFYNTDKLCVYDHLTSDKVELENPDFHVTPSDLAYVIFTSGSTGIPKGAMIEHRGMLNHLLSKITDLNIGPQDIVAQIATQVFDVSIWQYIVALLAGGKVVVYRHEAAWEPDLLLSLIDIDCVTIFESVPTHMYTYTRRT